MIGYTSGGSPIFAPRINTGRAKKQGKTMYACSGDENHRLTQNQARSSGYVCTHCGCDLKVKKNKVDELHSLAYSLGYAVCNNEEPE